MTNIHASGGFEMIKAASDSAKQTAEKLGVGKPILLAVTVLTSLNDELLTRIGFANKAADQVVILAKTRQGGGRGRRRLQSQRGGGHKARMRDGFCTS
jgi:orotidine-5'-phosphate decarboxylase